MAFVLEDGTGIDGANSYVSSDFYKDYVKDRGRTTTLGGSAINALLIQATDMVEARWLCKVTEDPLSETQGLTLPTANCEVTDVLRSAIVLYAEHIANPDNSLFSTQSERGPVSKERSKVGPIEEEFEYDTTKSRVGTTYQKIPTADLQMKKFLRSIGLSGFSKQVIRN